MAPRTFKYTGKYESARFRIRDENHELKKNTPFLTEDAGLIKLLSEHPDVKEVEKADEKPSSRSNAAK